MLEAANKRGRWEEVRFRVTQPRSAACRYVWPVAVCWYCSLETADLQTRVLFTISGTALLCSCCSEHIAEVFVAVVWTKYRTVDCSQTSHKNDARQYDRTQRPKKKPECDCCFAPSRAQAPRARHLRSVRFSLIHVRHDFCLFPWPDVDPEEPLLAVMWFSNRRWSSHLASRQEGEACLRGACTWILPSLLLLPAAYFFLLSLFMTNNHTCWQYKHRLHQLLLLLSRSQIPSKKQEHEYTWGRGKTQAVCFCMLWNCIQDACLAKSQPARLGSVSLGAGKLLKK